MILISRDSPGGLRKPRSSWTLPNSILGAEAGASGTGTGPCISGVGTRVVDPIRHRLHQLCRSIIWVKPSARDDGFETPDQVIDRVRLFLVEAHKPGCECLHCCHLRPLLSPYDSSSNMAAVFREILTRHMFNDFLSFVGPSIRNQFFSD